MYLSVLTSGNIFAILQKTNGIPHSLKLAKLPPKIMQSERCVKYDNISIVVIVSYLVSIDHWFLIEHCCIEAELASLY